MSSYLFQKDYNDINYTYEHYDMLSQNGVFYTCDTRLNIEEE